MDALLLTDLPVELVTRIVRELCTPRTTVTLGHILATCRVLRDGAQPLARTMKKFAGCSDPLSHEANEGRGDHSLHVGDIKIWRGKSIYGARWSGCGCAHPASMAICDSKDSSHCCGCKAHDGPPGSP